MHEIVTLQFGNRANHVGTHYWNTQESYFTYSGQEDSPIDHDRSWRQGIGADGSDTYTPRLLIYDLKGAFGSQRQINELYQAAGQPDPAFHNAWQGNTSVIHTTRVPPNPYLEALNMGLQAHIAPQTVRYWSDYNRVYYHPASSQQCNDYELNNPLTPFATFDAGQDLFNKLDRERDIIDTDLRPHVEACDQLQGFQMIGSVDDAWGGFASRYAESIIDEYGSGFIWMFAVSDAQDGRGRSQQEAINHIKTLSTMYPHLSIYVPLTKPRTYPSYMDLTWKDTLWYSGAVRNLYLESMTLPTRIREGHDGNSILGRLGYHIGSSVELPLSAASMSILEDNESQSEQSDARMVNGLRHDVVPDVEKILDIDFMPSQSTQQETSQVWSTYTFERSKHPTAKEKYSESIKQLSLHSSLLHPQQTSFPQLTQFSTNGYSVKTTLTASSRIAEYIQRLSHTARTVLDIDEREAVSHTLMDLAEGYKKTPEWESDTEEYD